MTAPRPDRSFEQVERTADIPEFDDERDAAEFWDAHEPGEGLGSHDMADVGPLPTPRARSIELSEDGRQERYDRLTTELRDQLAPDRGAVMIFLGAGLSFGVGRRLGRASFETPRPVDGDERFPSWPLLVERMRDDLASTAETQGERRMYEQFFAEHDSLDAAQLYRLDAGEERYQAFLRRQFETSADDARHLTPSHEALVALPAPELFTTNYDRLIELSFQRWDTELVVSSDSSELLAARAAQPTRHLTKLHGSIDKPTSIVLTRDDYARSRLDRSEMFRHLGQQSRFETFLFVGFSLTDPTFTIVRDEARAVMGSNMPSSYLVQQRVDPVTRRYLQSLDVETVELFSWNELPRFLHDINPVVTASTREG